jgi:hypothetical protein
MNLSSESENNLFEFYISASTHPKPDSTTRAPFLCPTSDGLLDMKFAQCSGGTTMIL